MICPSCGYENMKIHHDENGRRYYYCKICKHVVYLD